MDIDAAIEVFVRGFAFTRSFTHPFLAERVGDTWRLFDGPRKSGDFRTEQWVAHGAAPAAVDAAARAGARGGRGRFAICAIHAISQEDAPLRAAYKELGYRLRATEPLMVHPLKKIPRCPAPEGVRIERVMTQALADRVAKAEGSRQILQEHLREDAPLRQYAACAGEQIVGWVRSIRVPLSGDRGGRGGRWHANWCSNMYVEKAHRRRGIARVLLCRMLRDDRGAGSACAVLLASHVGAKLYPVVGYEQIGTLLLYSPRKK